jgi:hypothetical protein
MNRKKISLFTATDLVLTGNGFRVSGLFGLALKQFIRTSIPILDSVQYKGKKVPYPVCTLICLINLFLTTKFTGKVPVTGLKYVFRMHLPCYK